MATSTNRTAIPVQQLPNSAITAVHASLEPRGFKAQSMIEPDFAFSDREGRKINTNLLVFTHETFRNPDYTGITVFNPAGEINDEQLVQTLAQSAAPFHLIHNRQTRRFSLWFTKINERHAQEIELTRVEENIGYSRLREVFATYAADIQPQRIIDVKQGRDSFKHFDHVGPFQLALWAVEVTGEGLVQHFGQAVADLRQNNVPSQYIPDLSTQLLGATILAHTGALGVKFRQTDPSLDTLISAAAEKYPNYFDQYLFEKWYDAASRSYRILNELRYTNFSPELLTRLYLEAYPDIKQRRLLGRYDTPLHLTRRIWEALPIEYLSPDNRIVADMTCGWGSFLISGHARLANMIDMRGISLREHIYGNDNEPFTAKLAALGLLVSTLQDSWHISSQDALQWNIEGRRPTIIVGNPPFHGSRKTPSREHAKSGGRYERANRFLSHAIDLLEPSGYLAMLMPQSFVAAEASPDLRGKLLEKCDVLELWELPIGVFPDARVKPLVIIAQKKSKSSISSSPVRIRSVQRKQLDIFREQGLFTASGLVNSQSQWGEHSRLSRKNTHVLDYSLILTRSAWDKLRTNCVELSSKAVIFSGTILGNPKRRPHINDPDGIPVQWLTGKRNVIHNSFQITYRNPQLKTYPNDFEKPRLRMREILAGEKVLINALANPSWGKRVHAVIERNGFFVSHNFIVLVPNKNDQSISLEVIAAVIDWKVSNAWLLEHLRQPQFSMKAVESIPFPILTEADCIALTNAVRAIEKTWLQGKKHHSSALQIIDDVLREAYQLDDETYNQLTLIAEWDEVERETLDAQLDPEAQWEISGVVDDIDTERDEITLWLDGFNELQAVPIVPVMPGWLLRPDTAFRTSIPRASLKRRSLSGNTSWGFFSPQDYSYLTEEEALTELLKILS